MKVLVELEVMSSTLSRVVRISRCDILQKPPAVKQKRYKTGPVNGSSNEIQGNLFTEPYPVHVPA